MLSTLVRVHDNGHHKIVESDLLAFWATNAPATEATTPPFDLLLLVLYLTLHGGAPSVPCDSLDKTWTFEVVGHFTHLVRRVGGKVWRFAVYTPTAKKFDLFLVSMRIGDALKADGLAAVVLVSGVSLKVTAVDMDTPALAFDARMFTAKLDVLEDDAATDIAATMATILEALPEGFKASTFARTGAHVGKSIVCSPFDAGFEDVLKTTGGNAVKINDQDDGQNDVIKIEVEGTVVVQGDSKVTEDEPAFKKRKVTDELTVAAAMVKEGPVEITWQQLKGLVADKEQLRDDNKVLRSDNQDLRGDNKDLRGDNKDLRGQFKPLLDDNQQLRCQVTSLAAAHEVLRAQVKTLSDDMEQVRGQLKALGGAPPLHPKTSTSLRPTSSGASSTSSSSSGLLSSGQLSSSSSSSGSSSFGTSSSSGASARDSSSSSGASARDSSPESRNPSPAPVRSITLVWDSSLQSFRSPAAVPGTITVDNWRPTPLSSSSSSSYASSTLSATSATQPGAESPIRPMGNMLHVSPDGPSPPTQVPATTHVAPAVQPTAARMLQVDDDEETKNEAMH